MATSGIIIRSPGSAATYLLEDMRMNEDDLRGLNTAAMRDWLHNAPKRDSLLMVIKMIESL